MRLRFPAILVVYGWCSRRRIWLRLDRRQRAAAACVCCRGKSQSGSFHPKLPGSIIGGAHNPHSANRATRENSRRGGGRLSQPANWKSCSFDDSMSNQSTAQPTSSPASRRDDQHRRGTAHRETQCCPGQIRPKVFIKFENTAHKRPDTPASASCTRKRVPTPCCFFS